MNSLGERLFKKQNIFHRNNVYQVLYDNGIDLNGKKVTLYNNNEKITEGVITKVEQKNYGNVRGQHKNKELTIDGELIMVLISI